MKWFAWGLAIAGLAAAGPSARAATITVFNNNLAGFQAAAGSPAFLEDFSDATLVPGFSILSGNGTISGGRYNDVVDQPVVTPNDQVTFGFGPPVFAFGGDFDLTPGGAGLGIELEVFFAGGGSQVVATQIPATFSGQFFGIVSDMPISSIQLRGGTQGGVQETFTLDNVRFSQVPEPATLAVFGGLLAAGAAAARRRAAA